MKTDTKNTQLDNIAYYIYYQKYKSNFVLPSKYYFTTNKQHYEKYYIKATKLIRKQKLLKIYNEKM